MNNINSVGAQDCGLTKAYCGGRAMGPISSSYLTDSQLELTWQKNVNHYSSSTPGNFTVFFEDNESNALPLTLLVVPDDNKPSLTLYTYNITIPAVATNSATISLAYFSNTAPTYYACADFAIYNSL